MTEEFECPQEKQKRCISFYKDAFFNRKKYINILEDENSKLKARKLELENNNRILAQQIKENDLIIKNLKKKIKEYERYDSVNEHQITMDEFIG